MDEPRLPIDTTKITLSPELLELTELLASNVHDVWARQRRDEGWRYGHERNDQRKEHPDLVPYDQLPDSEKQYDRITALEAIKVILASGYRIEPPADRPAAAGLGPMQSQEVVAALQHLEGAAALDLSSLVALWRARDVDFWSRTPQLYRLLGARILRSGEPLVAYDVVTEGREHWPEDARLRQLQAHALLDSGAIQRANEILLELRREGCTDEETLGFLARTHKALALRAAEPVQEALHLLNAAVAYLDAYRHTGGTWTGINAASMSLLVGERDRAHALAREVHERCLQELDSLKKRGDDTYWPLATLGEAALILEQWSEAEAWYHQAAEVGRGRFGQLATTRRQARLLMHSLGSDPALIERCLPLARVVVFAGHMIDQPGRASPRFPPQLERAVQDAIRQRLERSDAGVGFASAACGADILFLEAIMGRGGEAHVVLPYDRDQFKKESVECASGAGWGERYERVLRRAAEVRTASEHRLEDGSVTYDYANLLLLGLAAIRAAQLETELVPLAVWDRRPGDGPGGTAATVQRWRKLGQKVEVIDLAAIRRCAYPRPALLPAGEPSPRPMQPPAKPPEAPMRIMAMLFADVVGFSRLTEAEILPFVQHFLGMVAELMAASPQAPVVKNTWGDALYLVFPSVRAAGLFALELCELVSHTNWPDKGLSKPLGIRIGLHAGPVYRCKDPVIRQTNYTGTHVSRAARIEPVTPPNQVYASEPFAALAAAERVSGFLCEYVGHTPLAKGYGTFRTYHVRRSA